MTILLFWLFTGALIYTFFGYPLLITLLAKVRCKPIHQAPITPTITLFIPAYNEKEIIAAKLENSLSLDYPSEKLNIVVVADGSEDGTVAICQQYPAVTVYFQPERQGKIAAINRGMPFIDSEIVVFSDANTMLDKGTLLAMARNFADPNIASVAGEKQVLGGGEGLYWRYESHLKRCDSRVGNVIGAAGEIFAMRTALFIPSEADSVVEDFIMSMRLVETGWRVIYEPEAIAREAPSKSLAADWQRRTRIAAGGFQSIPRLWSMLNPAKGLIAWQYFSHKVLRWLTPFFLILAFITNLLLWERPFYQLVLFGQILFYVLAGTGYLLSRWGKESGIAYAIFFFCFTNLATIAGFWRYITKGQAVTWQKVR
jgi:poly-beta-1,6-N-acetyl-D-glucosamine synthase